MSLIEVKKVEESPPIFESEDGLGYQDTVAGLSAVVLYYFIDDQLTKASYVFDNDYLNHNNHIDDYRKVKAIVIGKYGTPVVDDTIWSRDLFKDDPEGWGLAIATGQLVMRASWSVSDTNIMLQLWGENYEVSHALFYYSTEYAHLEELSQQREEDEKF